MDQSSQGVVVPDSYHVGEYHSPVSFKDRDKGWVSSQNPQGYTIELADDQKASKVAQKLYKAPKNDRMAQVRYQKNGKPYYKGVYGTYNSPEAAQKALDQLPAELKQGAGVKSWGSVQENLEE
jgi:septal ring-binding cell division protein DamX